MRHNDQYRDTPQPPGGPIDQLKQRKQVREATLAELTTQLAAFVRPTDEEDPARIARLHTLGWLLARNLHASAEPTHRHIVEACPDKMFVEICAVLATGSTNP